jgi:hypothetical protein
MAMYSIGAADCKGVTLPDKMASRSRWQKASTCAPNCAETRSTCLVGTTTPANSSKSARPCAKDSLAPTRPIIRRTPGLKELPTTSSS